MMARKQSILVLAGLAVSATSSAQIPDLVNALDAGGRAMGIGGGTYVTDGNTYSSAYNPAGLAYITSPSIGVSFRNLPTSSTLISGNFQDPEFASDVSLGKMAITHVGYAFPALGGTVGLAYTVAGYIRDTTVGDNLPNGQLTIRNYQETTRLQTDFFTASYGKKMGTMNWGAGLVIANQFISGSESYLLFNGNNQVGGNNSSASGNATGVGLIFGLQGTQSSTPNTSWGISVRTPIDLTNNNETSSYYDRIPGRVSFGFVNRSNAGSGADFLIFGAQADLYFGGQSDKIIPRKNHVAFGGGVEYNFHRFNGRIPVRLGFSAVPSGGEGFQARNTLTFGFGYRPNNSPLTVDFNFAKPTGKGPFDVGVSLTYRPNN